MSVEQPGGISRRNAIRGAAASAAGVTAMSLPGPVSAQSVVPAATPTTGPTITVQATDAGTFQVSWTTSSEFTYDVVYQRVGSPSSTTVTGVTSPATVKPTDWGAFDDNIEYDVFVNSIANSTPLASNTVRVTLNKAGNGGTVTAVVEGGVTYRVHTFSSDGTFTLAYPRDVEYLIVGGGGGGGSRHSGGGGAGGVRTGTSSAVSNGSYAVVVGTGGAGKAAWILNETVNAFAASGGASSWNGISAAGGGRGGSGGSGGAEEAGGSGGGSSFAAGAAGNTPSTSPSQGNAGGNGSNNNWSGGGGGGAGAVGGNSVPTGDVSGGNGGAGVTSSITGTSVTYAGGGGGSMESAWTGTAGRGGAGGGGAGGHLGWEMFNTRGILRWELYNTGSDGTPANSAVLDSMLTAGRLTASGFASIGTSNRNEAGSASSTLLDWTDASQLATATGATVPNSGNNFVLVVSGFFVPAETGTYTFKVLGDDSFDLYLNNDRIVSYYGYSDPAVEGTANLNAGQRYEFRVRVHEQGGGERLRVFWKSPGNSTWRQEGGLVAPSPPQTTAEMNSLMGLATRTVFGTSSLYNSTTSPPGVPPYDILNWIDAGTPTGATVPNSGNDFGFMVSGTFVPTETGTYTFTVAGDDAVDVLIGSTMVTSHYGPHAMGALGVNTGTISLTAGQKYRFRARQQDGGGGQGLSVFWRKPSQIASSYWWRDTTELSPNGRDGVDGLGGGGGGGGFASLTNMAGGRGGNGVVVLRYPVRV